MSNSSMNNQGSKVFFGLFEDDPDKVLALTSSTMEGKVWEIENQYSLDDPNQRHYDELPLVKEVYRQFSFRSLQIPNVLPTHGLAVLGSYGSFEKSIGDQIIEQSVPGEFSIGKIPFLWEPRAFWGEHGWYLQSTEGWKGAEVRVEITPERLYFESYGVWLRWDYPRRPKEEQLIYFPQSTTITLAE